MAGVLLLALLVPPNFGTTPVGPFWGTLGLRFKVPMLLGDIMIVAIELGGATSVLCVRVGGRASLPSAGCCPGGAAFSSSDSDSEAAASGRTEAAAAQPELP